MCKKIHRGGNAEQYYADKKYKEAVAVAVAKCTEDTKGQTCYICTQALHMALNEDPAATLDDLREAVAALEDLARTARRVLGSAHPSTAGIERTLRYARAALRAGEV